MGNSFSDAFSLPCGVPQGSVLGPSPPPPPPIFFTLYTTSINHIISNSNVTQNLYTDDTQIYLALDPKNFNSSIAKLTKCLTCGQKWMDSVKPKLNPEKKEFIITDDTQARESLMQNFPTQLLGNSISPTDGINKYNMAELQNI